MALATYDRNLVYGTDMEGDLEVFSIVYDETEEQFHIKVKWASGVQIAYDDRVAVADLSGISPVAAPGSALASIAASAAAIAGTVDADNDAIKTLAVTP